MEEASGNHTVITNNSTLTSSSINSNTELPDPVPTEPIDFADDTLNVVVIPLIVIGVLVIIAAMVNMEINTISK